VVSDLFAAARQSAQKKGVSALAIGDRDGGKFSRAIGMLAEAGLVK
jgi:hypothetical protein